MSSGTAAKLARIADELRVQGNGALKRSLAAGLRTGAKPLVPKVQAAAGRQLPQAGGLAARVAAEPVTVSVSLAANTLGVRLKTAHHDAYATNAGFVRHPVFGRPDSWVQQELPDAAGWWTKTLNAAAPGILPSLDVIVDRAAQKAFNA